MINTIYDRDFVERTREQARALRAARVLGTNLDLDWENLADEIEAMGRSATYTTTQVLGDWYPDPPA